MATPLLISFWLAAPAAAALPNPIAIGVLMAASLIGLVIPTFRPWVPALLAGVAMTNPLQAPLAAMGAAVILLFNALRTWGSAGHILAAATVAGTLSLVIPPAAEPYRLEATLFSVLMYLCWLLWQHAAIQRAFLSRLRRLRARLRQHRLIRTQYQAYLPTQADRAIQSGKTLDEIQHRRRFLVVFFSDIHEFTDRAEELEPSEVADFLNQYLTRMCGIAADFGGTVDKFIGDSLMITFGDDADSDATDNARRALRMAIAMQLEIDRLSEYFGGRPLLVRMGLASGYCTTGNFGADDRVEYTAIGKHVNLASRLEQAAEPGQILVSHTLRQAVAQEFEFTDRGQIPLKGFARPVSVYQLIGAASDSPTKQGSTTLEPD